MVKAKARSTTPKVPYLDPNKLKDEEFGLTIVGTCMEPLIREGSNIIVNRAKVPVAGELGVFFFKPEFVRPGDLQIKLKRLVTSVPKKRRRGEPNSTGLAPIIICEDASGRTYVYDPAHLLGVCKAEIPDENVIFHRAQANKEALLPYTKQPKRRAA